MISESVAVLFLGTVITSSPMSECPKTFPCVRQVAEQQPTGNSGWSSPAARLLFGDREPIAPIAVQDQGQELSQAVQENVRSCTNDKSGPGTVACWVKASPRKCEPQVLEMLSGRGRAYAAGFRAWNVCVASCAQANVWSRTLGECAREITKPIRDGNDPAAKGSDNQEVSVDQAVEIFERGCIGMSEAMGKEAGADAKAEAVRSCLSGAAAKMETDLKANQVSPDAKAKFEAIIGDLRVRASNR